MQLRSLNIKISGDEPLVQKKEIEKQTAPIVDIEDEKWEGEDDWDDAFQKFQEIIWEDKQKELEEKRNKFFALINSGRDWKIRLNISMADILVIARVLCRSLSLDDVLQHQLTSIFSCKEEKDMAHKILLRLLFTPRRSSSHREDMITHPNYIDRKYHGDHTGIIFDLDVPFNTYKNVDAQLLRCDYIYELIGPDAYKKRALKLIEKIIRR